MQTSVIPIEWLVNLTSVEAIKRELAVSDLPEDFCIELMQNIEPFLAQLKEGDELWKYTSPPKTWEGKCGSAGLAIKRNGKVILHKQLMMN